MQEARGSTAAHSAQGKHPVHVALLHYHKPTFCVLMAS